ncbi:MAG: outer membrane lipid asymmetry maintenance protein MlaD [Nitrospirae bacterium]|nr:MAG: outer membrane lipid asymmetry maintenance protein MlaD [Nitrospirota bacterium]
MKRLDIDFMVGLFVLAGIIALGYISVSLGNLDILNREGYRVFAEFEKVGGLKPGASVEIAGVSIGRVKSINLTEDFTAIVELALRSDIKLQEDAIASIKTKGLIGEKFIEITPGGAEETIPDGGRIQETESAVDLEELISKFVFGKVE